MEELKKLDELMKIDETHRLMGCLTGRFPNLELHPKIISAIALHDTVPEEIRGQFNVARNMALHQYFFYALAPEIQLKTYTIIEFALRLKANSARKLMLGALLEKAAKNGWIVDAGFRHIQNPLPENPYCTGLIKILPTLRNEAAHGSSNLTPDNIGHLEKCADLVNQLFPLPLETLQI